MGNGGGGFLQATRLVATTDDAPGVIPKGLNYNASKSNTGNICCGSHIAANGGFGGIGVSDASAGQAQHSFILVSGSTVAGNSGSGVIVSGRGAVISLSNVELNTNGTDASSARGGQLLSFGNNRVLLNTTTGAALSVVPQQ
jgi:hypothetical protein